MSGSQIQMPQFQGYTGQTITPPPVFGAAQAAGAGANAAYGIAQGGVNAQNQAFGQLAGGLGMYFGGRP